MLHAGRPGWSVVPSFAAGVHARGFQPLTVMIIAFMGSFGPFWLRFGVRVRVRVRGWVGSSPVP